MAENIFARGGLPAHVSAGTVAIESERAIAEAQGKLVVAKRFPRDEAKAFEKVMDACSRPSLAAVATYKYPRGGQSISGPSIRLAEELARCWGNIDYGIRELSRRDGVSEMEAYAWDLETNTLSSQKFTVRHVRDKQGGGVALTDERDIYEITANMGGRRLRARILAILPPDLVESAVDSCRQTLAGNSSEPMIDRVRKLLLAFRQYNVSEKLISEYLGKQLADMLDEDLIDLREIYNALKQGTAKASDFFDSRRELPPGGDDPANDNQANAAADGLKAAAAAAAKKRTAADAAKKTPEPTPEPEELEEEDGPTPEPTEKPAPRRTRSPAAKAAAAAAAPEPDPEPVQQDDTASDDGDLF